MQKRFTDEQVVEMRILRSNGLSIRRLADRFGISRSHTSGICTGLYYKDVSGPRTRRMYVDCEKRTILVQERQEEILAFITQFQEQEKYPPSIRDIVEGTSISSTSIVSRYLDMLEENGKISRKAATARTLRIV